MEINTALESSVKPQTHTREHQVYLVGSKSAGTVCDMAGPDPNKLFEQESSPMLTVLAGGLDVVAAELRPKSETYLHEEAEEWMLQNGSSLSTFVRLGPSLATTLNGVGTQMSSVVIRLSAASFQKCI